MDWDQGWLEKPQGFMTNAPCIAMQLQRRCPNTRGKVVHRHVILQGGRTKPAQIYPDGLCRAICKGLIDQLERDKRGQFLLAQLSGTNKETRDVQQQLNLEYPTVEEDQTAELEAAWDDVTGAALDPAGVKRARKEEMNT